MLRTQRIPVPFALALAVLSTRAFAQDVTWTPLAPATSFPAATAPASAYDPVSARVIAFGGFVGPGYSADTWAFDGQNWTKLTTPLAPPARAASHMAFDTVTQTLVMFGGFDGSHYLGDTWVFDGATSTWTNPSPATSPKGVTSPMLFTDPLNGHVDVYGGYDGNFYQLTTYQWTGTTWQNLQPATSPYARSAAIVALDPVHQNVVLYGGLGSVNPTNTWLWDGVNWHLQAPNVQPALRYDAGAAFDPRLGGVVVFGGGSGGVDLNDTWEWTGSDWQQLHPAKSPKAREAFVMAYDETIHRIVIAGGEKQGNLLADSASFVDEFFDLGPGAGGILGAPTLTGIGDLSAGSATGFTVTIGNTFPSTSVLLFVSLTESAVPLMGATLYPFPVQVIVPLFSATGTINIPTAMPAGVPSNTTFFMQAWMPDGSTTLGVSATNGLGATVP